MPREVRTAPDPLTSSRPRDEATPVCGVVLAAGRATRMGRPKALLESGGRSLLAHATRALREGGCAHVYVVILADAPDVLRAAEPLGTPVIAPADPAAHPIDSLRRALDALPASAEWAAVLPVDCPFVRPDTVARLIDAAGSASDAVVPVWKGTDGHPVLLSRTLFGRIRREQFAQGLRSLLADAATRVVRVPVDDEAVSIDIDTPADARRMGMRA